MRKENVLRTAREDSLKQGIQEKKLQFIKKMIQEGTDYEFISKITGKTIKKIEKIATSI